MPDIFWESKGPEDRQMVAGGVSHRISSNEFKPQQGRQTAGVYYVLPFTFCLSPLLGLMLYMALPVADATGYRLAVLRTYGST